jgi:protein-S-isoprenylcysteine O-methyltransferase Ste14
MQMLQALSIYRSLKSRACGDIIMISSLVIQTLAWFGAKGLTLFLAAGTFAWSFAWIFLVQMIVIFLAGGFWFARHDPGLLRERLSPLIQKEQPAADKILITLFVVVIFGAFAIMGLDAVRFEWSSMPPLGRAIGELALLLSMWIGFRTMQENTFAAPVVKVQDDRGQRVIASGPYRIVRHPMYAATIGFLFGTTLLLGSWWGLATVVLLLVLLGVRIHVEERTLRVGLAGYDDYAANVRYRLIPLIW